MVDTMVVVESVPILGVSEKPDYRGDGAPWLQGTKAQRPMAWGRFSYCGDMAHGYGGPSWLCGVASMLGPPQLGAQWLRRWTEHKHCSGTVVQLVKQSTIDREDTTSRWFIAYIVQYSVHP